MKILVKENVIIAIADNISYGEYEGESKWRLADAEDSLLYYVVDFDYTLVEGVTIPYDYEDGKYLFENGEFVLNAEWKPYVSPEKRITQLEEQLSIMEENDAELLYQVCLLQLGVSEEDLL